MTITKGLINVGMEFCADIESLAPRTRAHARAIDLTPSSLTVRAERLRSLLARTEAMSGSDAHDGHVIDESILRILEILDEWRRRAPVPADLAECEQVARERGALFLSLHRRQRADAARAMRSLAPTSSA